MEKSYLIGLETAVKLVEINLKYDLEPLQGINEYIESLKEATNE